MKQPTYLIIENNPERKRNMALSGLCLIGDWSLGWLEVPFSLTNEFRKKFGIVPSMLHSTCSASLSKDEILSFNKLRWNLY